MRKRLLSSLLTLTFFVGACDMSTLSTLSGGQYIDTLVGDFSKFGFRLNDPDPPPNQDPPEPDGTDNPSSN